jgi:Ca2+-binding RTX toxin-like protein
MATGHASGYTLPAGVDNLTLEGGANAFAAGNTGNNIITGNAGADTLITGGGNDILIAGTGVDTFVPTQQANTTTWIEGFNTSLDTIDLRAFGFTSFAAVQGAMTQSGSNVGINLGNGQLLMLQNQSVSNITANNVILPTYPTAPPSLPVSGAPNNWLSTATSGATLTAVAGFNNQLVANAFNVTLVGANLDDTFIAYDPGTVVIPGTGVDTVETWGSGYTLPVGVNNLTLEGSGNAFATGNAGNNIITGNAGTDTLTTGGGNDILIAGTGPDTFVPTQQANTTTWIEGFNPSLDRIDLSAYGFTSFAAVQAAMVQPGSNAAINLGSGQLLMLQNQSVSTLTASDVILSAGSTGSTSTGGTSTGSTSGGSPINPPGMTMTFDDEFNSLSLNMGTASTAGGTWTTYFSGWGVRTLSSNGEQELYVDPSYAGSSGSPLGLNPFSDQNGVLTITASPTPSQDNGAWGGIKDVTIKSAVNSDVTINNFVDAQVTLGNGGSVVTANNLMRGTISVGDGNSTISINATSNSSKNDTTTINVGNGSDRISFTGASNTKAAITAGNLGNTITVGGQASVTVKSGTGNDDFIDQSTGKLTLTGGGSDVFEFLAGAHATITDFQAGQDSIVLHGLTASQVQVTTSLGNTFIALGNGSQVELAGVSLATSQIHMVYA